MISLMLWKVCTSTSSPTTTSLWSSLWRTLWRRRFLWMSPSSLRIRRTWTRISHEETAEGTEHQSVKQLVLDNEVILNNRDVLLHKKTDVQGQYWSGSCWRWSWHKWRRNIPWCRATLQTLLRSTNSSYTWFLDVWIGVFRRLRERKREWHHEGWART